MNIEVDQLLVIIGELEVQRRLLMQRVAELEKQEMILLAKDPAK